MPDYKELFDRGARRLGSGSYKWDSDGSDPDMLPLWVADMDFTAAPPILSALFRRVDHGVFGYTFVGEDYYRAVIDWFADRHGWDIDRYSIIYVPGVVPAVTAIIQALSRPGDNVIVQTPSYNCFFSSIRNTGRRLAANSLLYDGHSYSIDFDDLEAKAADPRTSLMILCNPANPVGRVWTPDELARVGEICMRNGVTVIADEIHCELALFGNRYTPFASLGSEFAAASVSCISPSKAFNIAGLQIANIVAADDSMLRRIDRQVNINEVCDVNPFGVTATIAAYTQGAEWLEELIGYLQDNYTLLRNELAKIDIPVCELEGTYLAWTDCRSLGMSSAQLEEELKKEEKLWLNAGTIYGDDGEGFMRWNIACPRRILRNAIYRFTNFVNKLR